jgi:hypothetical protein
LFSPFFAIALACATQYNARQAYHRQHKEMSISNSILTARPKIFFYTSKRKVADEQLWSAIYGEKPPVFARLKEFASRYMQLGTRERKEFEAGTSPEDRDTLTALRLLRHAASMPERAAADLYSATRRLIPNYPKNLDARAIFTDGPQKILRLYADLLNANLQGARLHMRVQGTEPQVTILCRDLRTAAFVYAAFGGVEVCVGCGKLFAPNPQRTGQHYCSKNCGQRIYQREFRQRQKSKKPKSKRKG